MFHGNDFVFDIEFVVFSQGNFSYYLVYSACLICLHCEFSGEIAQ